MKARDSTSDFLFTYFSYIDNILSSLVDIMPPFVRAIIFKLMFKRIGKNAFIDYGCYFRFPWKIIIGDNVSINRKCSFYASFQFKDAFIKIGDDVTIAPECSFFSAGQQFQDRDLIHVGGNIVIEDGVYIGGKSTIRYGVTLGKGSIIAAGSVVVKDIAPYTIVGGVPAKQIGVRNLTSNLS